MPEALQPAPVNYALNRPSLQSSVSAEWSRSQKPIREARGGNNGDLSAPFGCHTDEEERPWWQVDLVFEIAIDRVVIYNRQECAYRLRFFCLLASFDGVEWRRFYRRTNPQTFGAGADDPLIIELDRPVIAKFVRLQLIGREILHFREFEVYGHPPAERERLAYRDDLAQRRQVLQAGRNGFIAKLDELSVFVDEDRYGSRVVAALQAGTYEQEERQLVEQMLHKTDRILEAGTAIGVVSMVAAACTSPAQVRSFDGNPEIIVDAKRNFEYNELEEIKASFGILKNRRHLKRSEKNVKFTIVRDFWASRLEVKASNKNIVKVVDAPVFCLEDEIAAHRANVLIIDIEGGEIELLRGADLSQIRLIIMETHYTRGGSEPTDVMIRDLICQGFNINLALSRWGVVVLRRKLDWNQKWLQPQVGRGRLALRGLLSRIGVTLRKSGGAQDEHRLL